MESSAPGNPPATATTVRNRNARRALQAGHTQILYEGHGIGQSASSFALLFCLCAIYWHVPSRILPAVTAEQWYCKKCDTVKPLTDFSGGKVISICFAATHKCFSHLSWVESGAEESPGGCLGWVCCLRGVGGDLQGARIVCKSRESLPPSLHLLSREKEGEGRGSAAPGDAPRQIGRGAVLSRFVWFFFFTPPLPFSIVRPNAYGPVHFVSCHKENTWAAIKYVCSECDKIVRRQCGELKRKEKTGEVAEKVGGKKRKQNKSKLTKIQIRKCVLSLCMPNTACQWTRKMSVCDTASFALPRYGISAPQACDEANAMCGAKD